MLLHFGVELRSNVSKLSLNMMHAGHQVFWKVSINYDLCVKCVVSGGALTKRSLLISHMMSEIL